MHWEAFSSSMHHASDSCLLLPACKDNGYAERWRRQVELHEGQSLLTAVSVLNSMCLQEPFYAGFADWVCQNAGSRPANQPEIHLLHQGSAAHFRLRETPPAAAAGAQALLHSICLLAGPTSCCLIV